MSQELLKCVVGMGGINLYKEIQMKIYGWTWNRTQDPWITSQLLYHWAIQENIHGPSRPNYHIPPPHPTPKDTHNKHKFTLSGLVE